MRKPNLRLLAVTCSFLLVSIAFGQLSGSSFAESKKSKTATFHYVYDNTQGFAKESNGKVTGLMVGIMEEFEKYLSEKEGITVSREFVLRRDFSKFLDEVREGAGGVFGLSNISINEERKKSYVFSPPCLDNVLLLVSNNEVPTLSSLDDMASSFNGLTAYTLNESSYFKRLSELKSQYYPNLKIETVPSESDVMDKLRAEKAIGILDFNYYLEALQKRYNIKRHPVGDLQNDQFGIIMPKSSDWEPVIKQFFESGFTGSSRYSQIISENLGSTALKLLNSVRTN